MGDAGGDPPRERKPFRKNGIALAIDIGRFT
jgi:hypothetical protein